RGMLAAQDVVAGVGRAGIAVVAVEPHGSGVAHARGGFAGLGAVADRIVGAVRVLMAAAREGIVVAHVGRLVARVGGADDVVVAVDRHPLVALAGGEVAGLDAVAEETVVARVGVAAGVRARVTGVLRAGDAVVAVRVGVAAARLGVEVAHARHRVAAVERADVVVVADDVRGVLALAGRGVAGLHARAEIAVGALRIGAAATRDRSVDAGSVAVVGHGVAGVGRADDAVVAGRRWHDGLAGAADAGLLAVAELAIVADDRGASAHVVAADVARGARVQVVARGGVVRVRTGAEPVALVVGADVAVVGARRLGRRVAAVRRLVAGLVALGAAGARVAAVRAGVGAVAEEAIVAGGGVRRVRAGAGPVAGIVGADVAVAGAGRPRGRVTVVGGLVARVVAFGPASTRVAAVRAGAAAAGVGAVAEEAVVAGGSVGRVGAGARRGADVVGADVAVAAERVVRRAGADPAGAHVAHRAGDAVVAGRAVGLVGMRAGRRAHGAVAHVGRAPVAVVRAARSRRLHRIGGTARAQGRERDQLAHLSGIPGRCLRASRAGDRL